jgi:hypothetical protein
MNAVRQRLGQGSRPDVELVGQRPEVAGRRANEVRERSVLVDADEHPVRADVPVAQSTQPALPAGHQRIDRRTPAHPLLRVLAGGDDLAGELVPHDQRRRAVAHATQVALDLRAADPHRAGTQHHLARLEIRRLRPLPDLHPLRALPHDRFHASPRRRPYTSRIPTP